MQTTARLPRFSKEKRNKYAKGLALAQYVRTLLLRQAHKAQSKQEYDTMTTTKKPAKKTAKNLTEMHAKKNSGCQVCGADVFHFRNSIGDEFVECTECGHAKLYKLS